jgi:NADPH:quinone reductase-like Zn-dependent oxidoreductase
VSRFVRIHEGSGLDRLRLDDIPVPEPGPAEVRISVEAFALNYGDFGLMEGDYPFTVQLPSTFGDEASGVIDAVGTGVTNFKVGDRVGTLPWMNAGYGVNGELAVVPEYYVTHCPKNLDANSSASIWITYLTAYCGLYTAAAITTDDFVLICAASSSAGIAATQLAKLAGATVIGTTRGDDNVQFILESGADHVLVTSEDELSARIAEITDGHGVRVVYDPVGGPLLQQYAGGLARNAIILLYGSMSGQESVVPLIEMIQTNSILRPHSVYNYIDDADWKQESIAFITDAMEDGRLHPPVDRSFPLDDFRSAYDYQWAAKNRRGKILINP